MNTPIIKAIAVAVPLTLGLTGCAGTPKPSQAEQTAMFANSTPRATIMHYIKAPAEDQVIVSGQHRKISHALGEHHKKHGAAVLNLPHKTERWLPPFKTAQAIVASWFKSAPKK